MATQAQYDKGIQDGYQAAELQGWTDAQWEWLYPAARIRMEATNVVEPVMQELEAEVLEQKERAGEPWESRKAPVLNAEMQEAIDARINAEWDDDDISLDLGVQQELIQSARTRRNELEQFASQPRTITGEIPAASLAWKAAEEALETEAETNAAISPNTQRYLIPGVIESLMQSVSFDDVSEDGWDKIIKSLKPRQILTEEDYLAFNDVKREALKIAYEQLDYEGVPQADWTKPVLEKRTKLIIGGLIPPHRKAIDATNNKMTKEEIVDLYESGPDLFEQYLMPALEWGTTTRRPGKGVMESGMMYGARITQAPVSAAVGAIEAAVTDKDLADAVAGRIEGGLGVLGGGIDFGGWVGSMGDDAASYIGFDSGDKFKTAGQWAGGLIGLGIDLYIPIDLGAVGTVGSMIRRGSTAYKIEKSLGAAGSSATQAAIKEGAMALGEAGRSGASRIVGGATLAPRIFTETTKSTKNLLAKVAAKTKSPKHPTTTKLIPETADEIGAASASSTAAKAAEEAADVARAADEAVDAAVSTSGDSIFGFTGAPTMVQNILKETKLQTRIKGQPATSVVTRIAQGFASKPVNIDNAQNVWNFKADYLKNRSVVDGISETPEAFFTRSTDYTTNWDDFVKLSEGGGFKVQNALDYSSFNKEAMEAIWIASLDDLLSVKTKQQILARGMAGSDELVNDIIKNWDVLGANKESVINIIMRVADEAQAAGNLKHWAIQVRNAVSKEGALTGGYAKSVIPKLDDTNASAAIAQTYAGRGVSDLVNELQVTGGLGVQARVKIGGRFLDTTQQKEIIAGMNNSQMNSVIKEVAANKKLVEVDGIVVIELTQEQATRILNDIGPVGIRPTGDDALDLIVSNSKDFNRVHKFLKEQAAYAAAEGENVLVRIGLAEWNIMVSAKVEALAAQKFGSRTVQQVAGDVNLASGKTKIEYANRVLSPEAIRNNIIGEKLLDVVSEFNAKISNKLKADPIGGEVVDNITSRLGALSENNASTLTRYRANGLTPTQAGAKLIIEDAFSSNPELILREYTNLILGGHEKIIRKPLTKGKTRIDVSPEDIDQLSSVILNTKVGKDFIEDMTYAIESGDNIYALVLLDKWHKKMAGSSIETVFGVKKELMAISDSIADVAKTAQAVDPLTVAPITSRLIEAADMIAPIYKPQDATTLVHIATLQQMKANIINDVLGNAAKKYPALFPNRKVIDNQSTIWFENVLLRNSLVKWIDKQTPPAAPPPISSSPPPTTPAPPTAPAPPTTPIVGASRTASEIGEELTLVSKQINDMEAVGGDFDLLNQILVKRALYDAQILAPRIGASYSQSFKTGLELEKARSTSAGLREFVDKTVDDVINTAVKTAASRARKTLYEARHRKAQPNVFGYAEKEKEIIIDKIVDEVMSDLYKRAPAVRGADTFDGLPTPEKSGVIPNIINNFNKGTRYQYRNDMLEALSHMRVRDIVENVVSTHLKLPPGQPLSSYVAKTGDVTGGIQGQAAAEANLLNRHKVLVNRKAKLIDTKAKATKRPAEAESPPPPPKPQEPTFIPNEANINLPPGGLGNYSGSRPPGALPFEKVSGEPVENALLELTRRLRHKLWVDDAVDNIFTARGVPQVNAFDKMMNSSVRRLLSLDEAQIAKLSDVAIEGGSMSPQQIVRELQNNPKLSKNVLKWMLGPNGSLKPAWRPGRAYAESLNPTSITLPEANRMEALLRASIAEPKTTGATQALVEAVSSEAQITKQLKTISERTGIQGVEETLQSLAIKQKYQIYDIAALSDDEVKALIKVIDSVKVYDRTTGQRWMNSFLTSAGYTNNMMKSGMLAGTFLPAMRYMANNTLTAPSIMYSTIGEIGLEGAGNLARGVRVVSFSNPLYVGSGKAAATEIIAVAPSGKAYTTEMIAEIMRTNGLSRSQASAELTSNVARDFQRETSIEFERFSKGLRTDSARREAAAWMDRNLTAWKGTNIWGKFANETDNSFRAGVLIAGIERGMPMQSAIKLSRESLFDYSKSIKGLHRFVWFLTFRANNWKTFAKNAVTNPNRLKNIMITGRGLPEEDIQGKWRAHISGTHYTAARIYFGGEEDPETKQKIGYYSPPIPQIEAAQDAMSIMQAHAESILIARGDTPVGDVDERLVKAYVRAAGENVNPWINLLASEFFGIDIRRGPDREVTNIVDGWLLMRMQQNPDTWDWFKDEFNIKPTPKGKEYPGASTFQGRQWTIDKNDEAARKSWNRWKFALMMAGQERGLREWDPILNKITGGVDRSREAGDVVPMKYDPTWGQSLGITTVIQEQSIEEIERANRKKTFYDIKP